MTIQIFSASPLILPIFERLLGDDCVVGAFTSVISLPGSQNQRLHKDFPALFPSTKWHHRLPNFAIQLIVPLVALDDKVGTTRVIKGSHTVRLGSGSENGDTRSLRAARLLLDQRLPIGALRARQQIRQSEADLNDHLQPPMVSRLRQLFETAAASHQRPTIRPHLPKPPKALLLVDGAKARLNHLLTTPDRKNPTRHSSDQACGPSAASIMHSKTRAPAVRSTRKRPKNSAWPAVQGFGAYGLSPAAALR